jgi:tricorn protease
MPRPTTSWTPGRRTGNGSTSPRASTTWAARPDIFRVAATGGTPLEVSREQYLSEFQAAPSPDGSSIALMARGLSNGQWWRNGHSHIDETEIWVKPVAEGGAYRKLLADAAKHAWPMWSPDGGSLYFMSDASGRRTCGAFRRRVGRPRR